MTIKIFKLEVRPYIGFLAVAVGILFVCRPAEADVELTFKRAETTAMKMAYISKSDANTDVLTVRFANDKIWVKGETLHIAVDYTAGEIYWEDQEKKQDGTLQPIEWKRRIADLKPSQKGSVNYNGTAAATATDTDKLKPRQAVLYKDLNFTKWGVKTKSALARHESLIWGLSTQGALEETRHHAERLLDTVGTIPRVPILDTWMRAIVKTKQMPALIYRMGVTRLPAGFGSGHAEEYLILTEINGVPVLNTADVGPLLSIKTNGERFSDAISGFQDKVGPWAPLIGIAAILLLIFTPYWSAALIDSMIHRGESKSQRKQQVRELAMRMYNELNAIRAAVDNPTMRGRLAPDITFFGRFSESGVYRKHFTKMEQASFKEIHGQLQKDGRTIYERGGVRESIDTLMKRCNDLIEKH